MVDTHLKSCLKVDLDNIDEKEFPNILDLEFQDCILEEGEMLYIPPKWWHYVRSLTTSFSVSFWWSDAEKLDDWSVSSRLYKGNQSNHHSSANSLVVFETCDDEFPKSGNLALLLKGLSNHYHEFSK